MSPEPVDVIFPWAMIWRTDTNHPGLHALNTAVDTIAGTGGWLSTPDVYWLPEPEASTPQARP